MRGCVSVSRACVSRACVSRGCVSVLIACERNSAGSLNSPSPAITPAHGAVRSIAVATSPRLTRSTILTILTRSMIITILIRLTRLTRGETVRYKEAVRYKEGRDGNSVI